MMLQYMLSLTTSTPTPTRPPLARIFPNGAMRSTVRPVELVQHDPTVTIRSARHALQTQRYTHIEATAYPMICSLVTKDPNAATLVKTSRMSFLHPE